MPRSIDVTLIGAAEHEAALTGLLERLERSGWRAQRIHETELERITERIVEVGERGLFVRCEGEHADELTLRRIESVLAKQGGPGHRLVRLDLLGRSPAVLATRIARECEALAELELAPARKPPPSSLSPEGEEQAAISVPAIRLAPGEQLDGDTLRIDLPDTPKLAELARRRKALRERGQAPARAELPAHHDVGSSAAGRVLDHRPPLDRRTLALLIAAALVAVLLALVVSGTIG